MQKLSDALENVTYDCIVFATRRTARAVTNYFNTLLRPFELNVAQFGLMTAIAKMPNRTLREIGEDLILDESTVTRNLNLLERRGLVQAEGGRGRLGKRMRLTRPGEDILLSVIAEWRVGNDALIARIPSDVLDGGRGFLETVTEASSALRTGQKLGCAPDPADME